MISAQALIVMFLPAILAQKGKSSVIGDLLALGAGFSIAFYLTLLRWMFKTGKIVNPFLASATGNFVGALVVALLTGVAGDPLIPGRGPWFFYFVALVDGCCVSCVIIAFAIAPQYITGAHIGMISLTETILGPLWVFAAFGEAPPVFTLIGGASSLPLSSPMNPSPSTKPEGTRLRWTSTTVSALLSPPPPPRPASMAWRS